MPERGAAAGLSGPEILIRDDPDSFTGAAVDWIAAGLGAAIGERGRASLALAGGRTPVPVYRALAGRAGIDWSRVEVYFGDERAVPPEDPESNFGMARETLLSRVPIPPSKVHRMEAERPDRAAAAAEYARLLPARLDLLLIGTGADGHTCSLFPGSPALAERERLVVPVRGPKPPPDRLTITPPVIRQARRIAVLARGAEKAPAIARALEGDAPEAAVPLVLCRGGTWFLDRAAASRLESRTR
jgi:6-phosphogluconolactonase